MNKQEKLDIIQSEFTRLNDAQSSLYTSLKALNTIEAVRIVRNALYS